MREKEKEQEEVGKAWDVMGKKKGRVPAPELWTDFTEPSGVGHLLQEAVKATYRMPCLPSGARMREAKTQAQPLLYEGQTGRVNHELKGSSGQQVLLSQ